MVISSSPMRPSRDCISCRALSSCLRWLSFSPWLCNSSWDFSLSQVLLCSSSEWFSEEIVSSWCFAVVWKEDREKGAKEREREREREREKEKGKKREHGTVVAEPKQAPKVTARRIRNKTETHTIQSRANTRRTRTFNALISSSYFALFSCDR